jgi:hypothetical protein
METEAEDRSIIGTYRGSHTYTGGKGTPHQFEFEINSLVGVNFHGVGTDGIGDFVVIGTYEMDRLTFKKVYRQREKAEVNYTGDFSIDGQSVTGHWWLPDMDGAWQARVIYVKKVSSPEPPRPRKEAASPAIAETPDPIVIAPVPQAPDPIVITPVAQAPNPVVITPVPQAPNPVAMTSIPETSASIDAIPEPATTDKNQDSSPRCSNCGAARGDFNFCSHCGHSFDLS